MKQIIYFLFFIIGLSSCSQPENSTKTTLNLYLPGDRKIEITDLPDDLSVPFNFKTEKEGMTINFEITPKNNYAVFKASAFSQNGEAECYFTISTSYQNQKPFNFYGEVEGDEIFRQSPHNLDAWVFPDYAIQPYPMVALKNEDSFFVIINGPPAFYDNYNTQEFYLSQNSVSISSGDNGKTPGLVPQKETIKDLKLANDQLFDLPKISAYYHKVNSSEGHIFEGIIFNSNTSNINSLRRDIALKTSDFWAQGKYPDYFGSLVFTSVFMNMRKNETGRSKYWVVPSVEYSNQQYCRDAFWISMMLPDSLAEEALNHELAKVDRFSEYPLYIPIWAYRLKKKGRNIELPKVQAYLDTINTMIKDGYYYTFDPKDKRKDYQYWQDPIAFDPSDPITYNQGLMAVCMMAARELGLSTKTTVEEAIKSYNSMFNHELGFFPMSRMKDSVLTPDPFAGDLLAQVLFGEKLLQPDLVKMHYDKVVTYAKTPFGYKINCMPDGSYLPSRLYDIPGYVSDVNVKKYSDGEYIRGGSWFLYDMIFLTNAWLHDIKGAHDELLWRSGLDFSMGSTVYECINTQTGEPWKPNMGWDAAAYYFWKNLIDEGKASDSLLQNIDNIVNQTR